MRACDEDNDDDYDDDDDGGFESAVGAIHNAICGFPGVRDALRVDDDDL